MEIKQTPISPGQPSAVPPIYFKSLAIENVKCFKTKSTLSFTDKRGQVARWSVILGENGIGKTTVLQCLAGLCARPDTVKQDGKEHAVVSQLMSDPSWFTWHESVQRKHASHTHSVFSSLSVGAKLGSQLEAETVPWECGFKINKETNVAFTVRQVGGEPAKFAGLQCYAYGAGRRMLRNPRPSQLPRFSESYYGLFVDDVALPNAEEWLLELDHVAKTDHPQSERSKRQFETVKELLIRVLPHVDDIRVTVLPKGTEASVRVEFKTPYGWVGANQLSFGYQTIVAWVIDLTRRLHLRYPESSNPVAEPAIVLIDELDLHLHPKWQVEVMNHLNATFENSQFIVTAHSPLIVQADLDANIILLERDGDQIRVNQDLNMVKEWRFDQILTSDLFKLDSARPKHLSTLIEERAAILAKPKLDDSDERRLRQLSDIIHAVPTGETSIERQAEEIIKNAAEYLKQAKRD